ncbi:MAG TPA: ArsA family ATPase [Miltoncostaeaceae bacterium]|nr:ArsA family ATPase [Miltoncostaeaceae bacterium]
MATDPVAPPLGARRLVFVLGKGGVGKSTVAAALGLLWARRGLRTLLVEVGGQHRLSALFGQDPPAGDETVELGPHLSARSIDVERATEEYLAGQLKVRPLVDLLTRSRAFHNFATAAPGLSEMVTLGKIWDLAVDLRDGRPVWDRIVVDCPATGHGVALLQIAANVSEMAGQGPIHDQAARIHEVVTHPAATGVVVVARPEDLPVTEAAEAVATLRGDGFPVAAAVMNAVEPVRFVPQEEPALRAAAGTPGAPGAAARAALAALARGTAEGLYGERLRTETGLEPIALPALPGEVLGPDDLGRLADVLEARDELAASGPAGPVTGGAPRPVRRPIPPTTQGSAVEA